MNRQAQNLINDIDKHLRRLIAIEETKLHAAKTAGSITAEWRSIRKLENLEAQLAA